MSAHAFDEEDERKRRIEEDGGSDNVKLDWKDHVALTIALLETSLLPFVLLIVIILLIALLITI